MQTSFNQMMMVSGQWQNQMEPVTLAFAELVRIVLSYWKGLTGGMMGVRGIPAPSIGSWTIDTPLEFFYLAAAVFVVGAIVYDAICYSVHGRALMAMRDDGRR